MKGNRQKGRHWRPLPFAFNQPGFQNFFKVLKTASACQKDFFDRLKTPGRSDLLPGFLAKETEHTFKMKKTNGNHEKLANFYGKKFEEGIAIWPPKLYSIGKWSKVE